MPRVVDSLRSWCKVLLPSSMVYGYGNNEIGGNSTNIGIRLGPQPCVAIPLVSIGISSGTEHLPVGTEMETKFTQHEATQI